jgi:hypothetical protein
MYLLKTHTLKFMLVFIWIFVRKYDISWPRYLKVDNSYVIMKFSRSTSRVRWFGFLETNVSKTISVLVLRVVEVGKVDNPDLYLPVKALFHTNFVFSFKNTF